MARIRSIKPEFWKNESLSLLPAETHNLAASLLNYADDEGYFNANPKLVKAECCPLRDDSTTIPRSLFLLSQVGYIRLGKGEDGRNYGHIVNFLEHQRVDKPKPSRINSIKIVWEESANDLVGIPDDSTEEGKGKEQGKEQGREGNGISPSLRSGDASPCPIQKIFKLYQEHCPNLRQAKLLNSKRQQQIRSRWREDTKRQNLDWWARYFAYCNERSFLRGKGDRGWVADLDYVTRDSGMTKIIEGAFQ